MEQPSPRQFKKAKANALKLNDVIKIAKQEISEISDLPVDSVIRCERIEDGSWSVVLELIESPARMGDNDLIAAYSITIDADGIATQVDRVGRYRREDGGGI